MFQACTLPDYTASSKIYLSRDLDYKDKIYICFMKPFITTTLQAGTENIVLKVKIK